MNPADLIQHSSLIWLMATGLLLGGLHALEPGHAKTMIASFVVATRGSVPQAILLGVSAALSHSLLVWVLAGAAIYFGNQFIGDQVEPWLQLGSGLVIIGIGLTMLWRHNRQGATRPDFQKGPQGGEMIDVDAGKVEITVFEEGIPPEFRLFFYDQKTRARCLPGASDVSARTIRPDGTSELFSFAQQEDYLVSTSAIPEPHEFEVVVSLAHAGHSHDYAVKFTEPHSHTDHHHAHEGPGHSHDRAHTHTHSQAGSDAHAQAHARQIQHRFDGRTVTSRQIALFGLSSGLIPCPAALTMLLVCLRLKRIILGVGLVTAFSAGLAIMLVMLGVIASLGVAHATRRLPNFDRWAGILPYASGALIVCVGVFMGFSGYQSLGIS